jgi:hypothetical protein
LDNKNIRFIILDMSEQPSPSMLVTPHLWLETLPEEHVRECIEMFNNFKTALSGLKGDESFEIALDPQNRWKVESFLTAWENRQDYKGILLEERNALREEWTRIQREGPGRKLYVKVFIGGHITYPEGV